MSGDGMKRWPKLLLSLAKRSGANAVEFFQAFEAEKTFVSEVSSLQKRLSDDPTEWTSSFFLHTCLSISLFLAVCLCVCVQTSVCLSGGLPACLSVSLSQKRLSDGLYLSLFIPVCLSFFFWLCVSVCVCLDVCLSGYLPVCLSVSLSVTQCLCQSVTQCLWQPVTQSLCQSVTQWPCLFHCLMSHVCCVSLPGYGGLAFLREYLDYIRECFV